MRTRNKSQKNKTNFFIKYLSKAYPVLLIILVVYIFSKNKGLILISVFLFLDIIKNILRKSMPYFLLEIRFIFGITASYFYHPNVALIIFFLGIVTRSVMLQIEFNYIFKAVRHIPIYYAVYFFRKIDFMIVAMTALTLNYFLRYVLKIAKQSDGLVDDMFYLAINFIFASIIFVLIATIYNYFPFLY